MSANIYQLARIPVIKRPQGYYLRWWFNGWHYWHFLAGGLTLNTSGQNYRTYGQRSITVSSGQINQAQAAAVCTVTTSTEVYIYTDSGWRIVRITAGTVQISNNFFNGFEIQFSLNIGSRLISETGYSPVIDIPVAPQPTYCEVEIGGQIWGCKNWDAAYPASRVYGDNEANRAVYGGLYTHTQVTSAGFAPAGWHVPTYEEWLTLINFLGGYTVAGGHLKEAGLTHWFTPNTDADNTSGFTALGAGGYVPSSGYVGLYSAANIWTRDSVDTTHGRLIQLTAYTAESLGVSLSKEIFLSVRLVKDTPVQVTDVDGNVYETVTIGTQVWMKQNFKATKLNDGTPIPNLTNDAAWAADAAGAYRLYGNDPAMKAVYGCLYNWFAINLANFAPAGWHVPTLAEWQTLIDFVGDENTAGGILKEAGNTHWSYPNIASDDYGFTALPNGNCSSAGVFSLLGSIAMFWSATELDAATAWLRGMSYSTAIMTYVAQAKNFGFGVRLIKD